ncbi:MAG: addiction module protein [bacterium]
MSEITEKILVEALELPPIERAELIEQLLVSFEFSSRQSIDELWAKEAEDRIDAYEKAELPTITAQEIFEKVNGK